MSGGGPGEGWTFCDVLDGKVRQEAIDIDDAGPTVGAADAFADAFADAGHDLTAASAQGHPATLSPSSAAGETT